MFDANMRHLPEGFQFFARVNSCNPHCEAYSLGVRDRDVVLCTMLEKTDKNPLVRFHLPTGTFEARGWAVGSTPTFSAEYEGNRDLSGFIFLDILAKATAIVAKLKKGTMVYKNPNSTPFSYRVVVDMGNWFLQIKKGSFGGFCGFQTKPTKRQIRAELKWFKGQTGI